MKTVLGGTLLSLLSLTVFGADKETIVFFRTYGYQEGESWVIPMRVWVYQPRNLVEQLTTKIASSLNKPTPQERANFKARVTYLVADDESREEVVFAFDHDPAQTPYRVQSAQGKFPKSDLNGLIQGFIRLSKAQADELRARQGSTDGWLTFRAISKGHSGVGRVQLIPPQGLSVISDIDDTIKITEIPAGHEVIVRNTFFRDFMAAPGMAERYRALPGAVFHYISGTPWQLYEPLADFLCGAQGGFPEGTFHMKNIRKNLLNAGTWRDLKDLTAGDSTVRGKVTHITTLLKAFPQRQFILVGDSGEHDPEVYAGIRQQFPAQIQGIWIRDVVNARENRPERLTGMEIIPAPTIVEGVSALGQN